MVDAFFGRKSTMHAIVRYSIESPVGAATNLRRRATASSVERSGRSINACKQALTHATLPNPSTLRADSIFHTIARFAAGAAAGKKSPRGRVRREEKVVGKNHA